MQIDFHQVRLRLGKGEHLRISAGRGARLTSVSGAAWITVERLAEDTLLAAGDSFLVPSDLDVLIGPLFSSVTLDLHGRGDMTTCTLRSRADVGKQLRSLYRLVMTHLPRRGDARGSASITPSTTVH